MGYAWLPSEFIAQGTSIEIESPQGTLPATVVALPFFDRNKDVPKA
jgi:glycine cleavage system aminomethyltransferase T